MLPSPAAANPAGSGRQLRPRPGEAPLSALSAAPVVRLYEGPKHGGDRVAECEWLATDAVENGAFADRWVSAADRARMAAHAPHLGVIVTCFDNRGRWCPQTVLTEAATQPGEWGYFPARRLSDGDPIGAMLDLEAVKGPSSSRYLVKLRGRRYDGAASRPGGPTRANDPIGTGLHANAEFHSQGWLRVKPGSTIEALSPHLSPTQRRRAEILWSYGDEYWK